MRLAVTQFSTSVDLNANLHECLQIIHKASACEPDVILLPQFCNTDFCDEIASEYTKEQVWEHALVADCSFLNNIGQAAKLYACYIVINVTLRLEKLAGGDKAESSAVIIATCVFSPEGKLISKQGKQHLSIEEDKFFISADNFSLIYSSVKPANGTLDKVNKQLIETKAGEVGLLSGFESMKFAFSRELGDMGAKLICNSISTSYADQCDLHDFSRACENNVFFASANKVGAISHDVSNKEYSGHSQILSPKGDVLAKMGADDVGFIYADINLQDPSVGLANKRRPDGTNYKDQLRPNLYLRGEYDQVDNKPVDSLLKGDAFTTANVAVFATYKTNEEAIEDVCHYIENNLSDIIQLPELFFISDKSSLHSMDKHTEIQSLTKLLIDKVSNVLGLYQYICTSSVIAGQHQALIIGKKGVVAQQPQLHFCERYKWTPIGDKLNLVALELEQGVLQVAMLTADDANIPEIVNSAALSNVKLLLVPFDIQEQSEPQFTLIAQAAENNLCILAASKEKSFNVNNVTNKQNAIKNVFAKNKVKSQKSTGVIINLSSDKNKNAQWRASSNPNYINKPIVKQQFGKITKSVIHPFATPNKNN